MGELIAAAVTTLDIIVVYALLQIREGKLSLALWTSFLNIALPFLGFLTGEFSSFIFAGWTHLLSGVLLALIGLHMLLHDENDDSYPGKIPPILLAFAVSIDAFSVSVSFGMLHLNKIIFIGASGLFSFIWAYLALHLRGRLGAKSGKRLRQFAGFILFIMGVLSCIR